MDLCIHFTESSRQATGMAGWVPFLFCEGYRSKMKMGRHTKLYKYLCVYMLEDGKVTRNA